MDRTSLIREERDLAEKITMYEASREILSRKDREEESKMIQKLKEIRRKIDAL